MNPGPSNEQMFQIGQGMVMRPSMHLFCLCRMLCIVNLFLTQEEGDVSIPFPGRVRFKL